MATPQLSPGVLVREVDLTVGRADNVLDNIGAIAAPFKSGPIEESVLISSQSQLINVFGRPQSNDRQYEDWMVASEYLSYGGTLQVVRIDGSNLNNANAGVSIASTTLKIKNYDDYEANYSSRTDFFYASKEAGEVNTNLKVCTIDNFADQTIGITTTSPVGAGATVGFGVTVQLSSVATPGAGTTTQFTGYLKGIITGVTTDSSSQMKSSIDVKIVSRVSGMATDSGTEYPITYQVGDPGKSIEVADVLTFVENSGANVKTATVATAVDWYDQQTLGLTNSTIFWKNLAPRPVDNNYSSSRNAHNDAIHVAVVDDFGTVTGSQGNILETNFFLSKALDGEEDGNAPVKNYYKNFLANNSAYIYAGANPGTTTDVVNGFLNAQAGGFSSGYTKVTSGAGAWGLDAQGVTYNVLGNVTYTLAGGADYGASGGMAASLGDVLNGYNLFENKDEIGVDFLLMGSSMNDQLSTQAKANLLISIAENRKDCQAVISPHRTNVVNATSSTAATNAVLNYYSQISSSSFAVLDSGYKYVYDRFNNEFRFIPLNGDIAGIMARNNTIYLPWFSPAGQARGTLNNVVKLAYNPNKSQRDQLYKARINPVINQNAAGAILFGDKTALNYKSAFDRINVRRLFLTVEQSLEAAANDQLFELNDAETRSNFINIVEPFLTDIQSQRGIEDFRVICDETNNTPDIVDNNEFRADIFIQPARSINFVTLTFVATRGGISFAEVTGT
jgi:hypothetical protein|tara:strand:+ start:1992 stop:4187 length:2196 start_codon:yes stop_codon:yes gene_type:complete